MRLRKLLSLLLTLVMVMSMFTITATTVSAANTGKIKNVIYLIPDGGGMIPFNLADAVKQAGGLNRSMFPYATQQTVNKMYLKDYLVAGMTTHAANAAITDSAAAGTAMAIGHKTNLYQIGLDASYKPKANILEAAQLSNRKTGLVTRYEFAHATPAAFSAHAVNRSDYRMMSEQIINQGIDVVLSPGLYNNSCQFKDSYDLVDSLGYTIINSKAELASIQKGDRVWSNMPTYSFDYQNNAASPTLAEMTDAAIRALENDNGFFLMVEGSSIDTGGHDNNAMEMVGNFIAFDEACKIAIEWAKGRNDTIVIAAPDHDTGGMNIVNQTTAVNEIINGTNPKTALTWTSKDHTARNGGVFMYVPSGISYPKGAASTPGASSNFTNYVIDNDDLAPYLADCMGVDLADATDELFVNVSSLGTYTKTYDSESASSNYTGTFKFNNANCTIGANQSYATINGEKVSLDGQIAFYEYYSGKFYVPQKLLNYLDGTEVPDEDATTGGGTSTNNSIITETSITKMGTAATFWGNVSTYENVTNNGNDSFTIQPGGYATFNVPVVNKGIYYLQIKSSGGDTTLEMSVNDAYFAELPVGTAEKNYYKNSDGGYEFLYFAPGKASLKLMNTGSQACTVSDIQLVASQNAVNAGVTPTMSDVKQYAIWMYAAQIQTNHYNGYVNGGTLSKTLAPGASTTLSLSGMPYTGVYAVQLKVSSLSGTANIRVTSSEGSYGDYAITQTNVWTNRMTPGQDQPIYFKKGSNTLTIKNTGTTSFTLAEYDFGRMDMGNSMEFKNYLKWEGNSSVTPTPTPTPAPSGPSTGVPEIPATTFDTWCNNYREIGNVYGTQYWPNGKKTYLDDAYKGNYAQQTYMSVGQSVTYNITAPYTGVYAFQTYAGDYSGGFPVFEVSTEEGYYYQMTRSSTSWSTGDNSDGLIFLREGQNTVTVRKQVYTKLTSVYSCPAVTIPLWRSIT